MQRVCAVHHGCEASRLIPSIADVSQTEAIAKPVKDSVAREAHEVSFRLGPAAT